MAQYSFPSEEKLKSSKLISKLFNEGNSHFSYPIKFLYLLEKPQQWAKPQASVSVSSKTFKKAVDRNLIKRRMREAFRLNKSDLLDIMKAENVSFYGMFIYVAKEVLSYQEIENGISKIIQKMNPK